MFDEPSEDPSERVVNPADRAKDKSDEFRMHAELCAVFEAHRKFDAALLSGLDADVARDVQRAMGRLEKAKAPDSPVLPPAVAADAAALLNLPNADDAKSAGGGGGGDGLPTNHYHIYRRPGEAMVVRWLEGEQVDAYYERLQAHFDAALEGFKEDERQALEWKQDPNTAAYLKAIDAIDVKMAERYLRDPIRAHGLHVLSTQTADEINIAYLAETVMGVPAAEVVGAASAPPEDGPTERDLAWFFKLFCLRGLRDGVEQMCFFAYLQKSDDGGW